MKTSGKRKIAWVTIDLAWLPYPLRPLHYEHKQCLPSWTLDLLTKDRTSLTVFLLS